VNVGSLFSGIGGIELGFEKAGGFEVKWFVENEPYCQAVLRKHWSKVPIYGDIKTIDFRNLEKVDILTGGFPCQDISTAGKGKGLAGERSGLWREFVRAIGEIRPRIAFIENVPNLVNKGLHVVLADLAKIGYDAEWVCICASDFGALHKRERIFIIAYPNSKRCNNSKHLEPKNKKLSHHDKKRNHSPPNWGGANERDWLDKTSPIFIANAFRERIQRFSKKTLSGKSGLSWCKDIRSIENLRERTDLPEPLLCRNTNGISERLHAIGNAVVPQVAEFFAEIVKEKIK
jgi:DNA (cytosine-5)-methyltransferase 1